MRKVCPTHATKFDIDHKILNEFSDLESRHILFSIISKSKSIQEITKELKMPLSSAYKKIQSLEENALISSELIFGDNGHKVKLYQSKIIDASITISKFKPTIMFKKNLKNQNV